MGGLTNFFQKGFFIGKRPKSRKDYLLALDIGTEFVKVLIFKAEKKSSDKRDRKRQGLVIGAGRQRQSPGHMLAGAVADIDGVVLTCQKAIDQAAKMARVNPKRTVIGVAGEFIKGCTTSFMCKRENPEEPIDIVELQNIIHKIQNKAFCKMRSQLAWETGKNEVEIKPINALLTEARIDGYQVTNPLGFQGKEFFLSIFNVYAPLIHLRALESIAAKLELDLFSIAAEPYALTRSVIGRQGSAIFIDIGGGTTDIALVRQGRVEGIKSLSLAGRTFTKRLGQMFDLGLSEAEEIKISRSNQKLSQNVQQKINDIFDKDVNVWLNGVELVLEEFNQDEFFPCSILLCGGGSLLPDIKNILDRKDIQKRWLEKFPFSQPFQVNFIQASQINNIIDKTGTLKGAENITPLALANLTLEIAVDEKKVLPPILRRVVRIMR
ncbi:MAG: cell division FtsA domain-containing protein [bacterium]